MHKKARAIHGGYMIDKLHDRTKMFLSQIRSEGLGTRTALCYPWVRWFGVLRAFSSSRSVAFRSVLSGGSRRVGRGCTGFVICLYVSGCTVFVICLYVSGCTVIVICLYVSGCTVFVICFYVSGCAVFVICFYVSGYAIFI